MYFFQYLSLITLFHGLKSINAGYNPESGIIAVKDSNPLDCQVDQVEIATLHLEVGATDTVPIDSVVLNKDTPTYFVIHGWREDAEIEEYSLIGKALFNKTQGQVILVDYKEIADEFYTCAWFTATRVGEILIDFILEQIQNGHLKESNIHLIGHSLGAQIAGIVGRAIKAETGVKIARISALDPAGVFFNLLVLPFPLWTLSQDDAKMVDAVHTSLAFGSIQRVGHFDVYVTGFLGLPMFFTCGATWDFVTCGHALSKKLFLESITSCGLVASHWLWWSTTTVYGFNMPQQIYEGVYSLGVNKQSPYGTGASCPANSG